MNHSGGSILIWRSGSVFITRSCSFAQPEGTTTFNQNWQNLDSTQMDPTVFWSLITTRRHSVLTHDRTQTTGQKQIEMLYCMPYNLSSKNKIRILNLQREFCCFRVWKHSSYCVKMILRLKVLFLISNYFRHKIKKINYHF